MVLSLEGITKRFSGVTALDGVGIDLAAGEAHALVGENGAGKSTLIKVMTGFYQPDGGEMRLDGRTVHWASAHDAQSAGIRTVYQEVNLIPARSVAENLLLGEEPRRRFGLIDVRARSARAREILERYGLGGIDVDAPVGSLGLGTQQMVAIVRAVSGEARVIVLDEPTSALAAEEVDRLVSVVDRLVGEGVAVLYVSHRLDEIYRLCQKVTVLRDGNVVHSGRLADLPRAELVAAMLGRALADGPAHAPGRDEGPADDRPLLLEAKGVTTGSGRRVEDVTLGVRTGEVVGLAGLLGAGKTETFKAIFGVDRPVSGEVRVAGRKIRPGSPGSAIRAGLAFLPEDRKAEGIVPNLSVRDNILLAARRKVSRGGIVSRKAADAVVEDLMRRLRVKASSPSQPVRELSGGNQQKVLLARWLCLEPKVLILDDPTRGIDVGAKAEVRDLVASLAGDGLGVLMTSSEIEEIVESAERVVLVRDGRVVGEVGGPTLDADAVVRMLAEGSAVAADTGAPSGAGEVAG